MPSTPSKNGPACHRPGSIFTKDPKGILNACRSDAVGGCSSERVGFATTRYQGSGAREPVSHQTRSVVCCRFRYDHPKTVHSSIDNRNAFTHTQTLRDFRMVGDAIEDQSFPLKVHYIKAWYALAELELGVFAIERLPIICGTNQLAKWCEVLSCG